MPDLSAVNDHELLRRHATGGDREAFGELFRRHRDRLWAVALRTMSDPDEAADALQDAMVNAYRAAARFRGDSAVTTWLHRIVVNACLDRLRRRAARPATPMSEQLPEPPSPATDPGDQAVMLAVREALGQLPYDQRAVVVYIDMLGYPVSEVAAILAVPPGTVKSRASRARAQLAKMLDGEGNQTGSDDVGTVSAPRPGVPESKDHPAMRQPRDHRLGKEESP